MADRPILFSAPMVRALLDGRKTQTRRLIPSATVDAYYEYDDWCRSVSAGVPTSRQWEPEYFLERTRIKAGDRLWVRESGQLLREAYEHEPGVGDLYRDAGFYHSADGEIVAARSYDTPIREWVDDCARVNRPSIHMPRWASRLTLPVGDVRVERLQDISEEDALAEGAYVGKASGRIADSQMAMNLGMWFATSRAWYADLWDRINGKGSWETNPWVSATTFTVERRNIDMGAPHV